MARATQPVARGKLGPVRVEKQHVHVAGGIVHDTAIRIAAEDVANSSSIVVRFNRDEPPASYDGGRGFPLPARSEEAHNKRDTNERGSQKRVLRTSGVLKGGAA